jgi:predicted ArsR family transcriptional regulator
METLRPGPSGETIDTPRHRALGSASRARILRLIQAEAGLTGGEVTARTGLHPSTVRVHLERLVQAGLLVKARAAGGVPGRPPWRYRIAAPQPAPPPYRTLAAALLDHLATTGGGAPAAVVAGQAWGVRLAADPARPAGPVEAAVDVLQELGFDPHRVPAGAAGGEVEVHLRTCPFLELVGQHPDVMCGLHAGLIQGVVRAAGLPGSHASLEPFAAPTACVARLQVPAPPGGDRR